MTRKEKIINNIIQITSSSTGEIKKELFEDKQYCLHFTSTKDIANKLNLSMQTVRKYCNTILTMDIENFKWDKRKGIVFYKNYLT